jgi:hypothetical protein
MSDLLQIALVAEGKTDYVIINAALRAILKQPFHLQLLQPEQTQPELGTGWGGVFKWCRAFRAGGYAALKDDPKLELFDVVVLHLDADVADKQYADYGPEFAAMAAGLRALPCVQPCPPAVDTVAQLRAVLLDWLGIEAPGPQAVLCLPSKATEAWLLAALLPEGDARLAGLECNMNTEGILASLPKGQRVKKSKREYEKHAAQITQAWTQLICRRSGQARQFEADMLAAATLDAMPPLAR